MVSIWVPQTHVLLLWRARCARDDRQHRMDDQCVQMLLVYVTVSMIPLKQQQLHLQVPGWQQPKSPAAIARMHLMQAVGLAAVGMYAGVWFA